MLGNLIDADPATLSIGKQVIGAIKRKIRQTSLRPSP